MVGKEKAGGYSPPCRPRHAALPSPHHISGCFFQFSSTLTAERISKLEQTGEQWRPGRLPQLSSGCSSVATQVRVSCPASQGQGRGAGAVATSRDSSPSGACNGNACRASAGQERTQLQEAAPLPGSPPPPAFRLSPRNINTLKNSLAAGRHYKFP